MILDGETMEEYFHGKPTGRVVIEEPVLVKDSFGQERPTWVEVCDCYEWAVPVTAKEIFTSQAQHSTRAAVIRVRFIPNLKATWRVKRRGLTYKISGITELLPNKGYDLGLEVIE